MTAPGTSATTRVVLWLAFAFMVLAIWVNTSRNPLTDANTQMDEEAHMSYVHYLVSHDVWWPDFDHFPMYDRASGRTFEIPNYINHPPTFYWLARAACDVGGICTPQHWRWGAMALTFLTFFLYIRIGTRLQLRLWGAALYGFLPILAYAQLQTGFFSNDAAALLGGVLVVGASLAYFDDRFTMRYRTLLLLGLALASVKLTSFLLVTSYVLCSILLRPLLLRPSTRWQAWVLVLWLAILALPFLVLWQQWGGPAPETFGQHALISHRTTDSTHWSRHPISGWQHEDRMTFWPWLLTYLRYYGHQIESHDTTPLAIALVLLGMLTCLRARGNHHSGMPDTIRAICLAAMFSTLAVFAIHTAFSWVRYEKYGWLRDANIRYYFPLFPAYGILAIHGIEALLKRKGNP